jgi:hypothetical protein
VTLCCFCLRASFKGREVGGGGGGRGRQGEGEGGWQGAAGEGGEGRGDERVKWKQ